jgi:hypothetical protein
MRVIFVIILLPCNLAFASSFSPNVKLCAWPISEGKEKFLMFNFKSRSQVIIKLEGGKVRDLGKGPYFFDLKILNPKHKESEYRAELLKAQICDPKKAIRFVDGELKEIK